MTALITPELLATQQQLNAAYVTTSGINPDELRQSLRAQQVTTALTELMTRTIHERHDANRELRLGTSAERMVELVEARNRATRLENALQTVLTLAGDRL